MPLEMSGAARVLGKGNSAYILQFYSTLNYPRLTCKCAR